MTHEPEGAPTPERDEVLTAGEVADLFKVSLVTVGTWADEKKLPSFRTPGGHRRFYRKDVEDFIAKAAS